jgi:uncharacterized protein YhaN
LNNILLQYTPNVGNVEAILDKMWAKAEEYRTMSAKLQYLQGNAMASDNSEQYKDKVARLSAAIGETNAQQLDREREIAATEVKIRTILSSYDVAELSSQLNSVEEKRQQAEYKYSVVVTALELLNEAKNSLAVSYLPRLNKLSSEYLAKFTGGEFDKIVADKDFAVSIEEKGVTKQHRYFSRGVKELALFCFKLALSKEIYGGKIPLLILDDVFVNLDEEKFRKAVGELLHTDIASQIIYFTCHERINKAIAGQARNDEL